MAPTARRGRGARSGLTLIEVMVSLVLLGLLGIAGVELSGSAVRLATVAQDAERELANAAELLHAMTLWSSNELDLRLGDRAQGPWRVEIVRHGPDLYLITIRDSLAARTILSTGIFAERNTDEAF